MKKSIVICSGGLDSTTVAAHVKFIEKRDPVLLHFLYGCRAEKREINSIIKIAEYLKCDFKFISMNFLRDLGHSNLIDKKEKITDGVQGSEFPQEWVPARNLMMISHAAAYCDAYQIDEIYMGLNLEEGAVYPDNTIEFYERMNQILPVATLSRPLIKMPLARMMKHEIVRYAYEIEAPIYLSWSCYEGGDFHCGKCGPCYMRKTAHKMNYLKDPIQYES